MYSMSPTVNDYSDTLGKLFNLGKIMAKLCKQLLFILGITWTREFRTLQTNIIAQTKKIKGLTRIFRKYISLGLLLPKICRQE